MNTSDISDIIEQLSNLQIKQNELIAQLIAQKDNRKHNSKDNTKSETPTGPKEDKSEEDKTIKIGDRIILLTKGVKSKKGDEARVTDIKGAITYFIITRNGHNTYRKITNVRKSR